MTGADAVQKIGELTVLAQRYEQVAHQLVAGSTELKALVNALPNLLVDYAIGAGQWTEYKNKLTDAQVAELATEVGRGDLVQVVLHAAKDDLKNAKRRLGRVVFVDIENMKAPIVQIVYWEDDEVDKSNRVALKDVRQDIWGKRVYRKVGGA